MARRVVPLSENQIKQLKPKDKRYKKADGNGLYIWVTPVGTKIFKYHYMLKSEKKREVITIGEYPLFSLQEAREIANNFGRVVKENRHPSMKNKEEDSLTFKAVAELYLDNALCKEDTKNGYFRMLENHVYHFIGEKSVKEVTKDDIVSIFTVMGKKKLGNTVKKTKGLLERIFRYSITKGYSESTPMIINVYDVAPKQPTKNFRHITDEEDIRDMMRKIRAFEPTLLVSKIAVNLIPYVFVRNSNMITAEWSEIDFDKKTWTIPALKMKRDRDFVIPLSDKVISLFKEVEYTKEFSNYVFYSTQSKSKHISEGTILKALERLKVDTTTHGMRHMASTILHENMSRIGVSSDAIELQLSHTGSGVKAVYNKSSMWEERVTLMNWWSDYLDSL